jgi:3-oxoacyl-[acyl-carrier protein] reductase
MDPYPSNLLTGRVVIVTGGSSGIGRGIAEAVLAAGGAVVIAARGDRVNEAASRPNVDGMRVMGHRCDVRDPDSVASMVHATVQRFGRLDVLINNAAAARSARSILDLTVGDWEGPLRTNVVGTFLCSQAAARHFVKNGQGGRIINIASMAAIRPMRGRAHYNASKAAIVSLTQTSALELAKYGITVNAIAPGIIDNETSRSMQSGSLSVEDATYLSELRARIPFGRMGQINEVANAVLFFASGAASYVTGQVLAVDGGITT